jgi:hypothetical protein
MGWVRSERARKVRCPFFLPVRNEAKAFPRQLKTGEQASRRAGEINEREAGRIAEHRFTTARSKSGLKLQLRGNWRGEESTVESFLCSIAFKSSFGGDLGPLRNEGAVVPEEA